MGKKPLTRKPNKRNILPDAQALIESAKEKHSASIRARARAHNLETIQGMYPKGFRSAIRLLKKQAKSTRTSAKKDIKAVKKIIYKTNPPESGKRGRYGIFQ